ncbi:MAG: hypothetical protein HKP56_04265, partial [Anderseniella sp.]|nr:hypothetical protein [Anderseniella sp.]
MKRKFLTAVAILAVAGAGYWAIDAYRFPTSEIQFSSLETCLEQSDYTCVARAAYKAMPFEQAKRRNHQIGMVLAFAGDTDLAMSTLKAEREYWRKTRIAGAMIARHIVSDSESDIGPVMYQLDSLVQQAISLQQAGSFLSKVDTNT